MGILEDAIASGRLTQSNVVRSPDEGGYDPNEQRGYENALLRIRGNAQAMQQRQGLQDLVTLSQATRGLDPEAQAAIYGRFGINFKPRDKEAAALRRQMQLAAFKEAIRGEGGRKRGSGVLPADLIGAIGTPDFGRRLQDAASGGGIDRQGLETLYDLDRKEREFQAKGIAKPGKQSPYALKLLEMESLGVPITEETVRGVYGDKTPIVRQKQGGWLGFGAKDVPLPTISPSQIFRQAAGLGGGVSAEPDEPLDVEEPPVSDLRKRLFGE